MKNILFIISVVFLNSFIYAQTSSLGIFYFKPYSDIFSNANLTLVSQFEKERGSINSAFLGELKKNSLSLSLWRDYYGSGTYSFISASYKVNSDFGIGLYYFGYTSGEENIYYLDGTTDSMVFEKDYILGLNVGKKVSDNILAGLKLKSFKTILAENYKGSGFSFDLDSIFKFRNSFFLYLGVENIGGNIKYDTEEEKMPVFYKFEFCKVFYFNKLTLRSGIGMNISDYNVYSIANSVKFIDIPVIINMGFLKDEMDNFYSFGFSVNLEDIVIGYGIKLPQVFDNTTQRFSISYFFGLNESKYKENIIKKTNDKKTITPKPDKDKKSYNDIILF